MRPRLVVWHVCCWHQSVDHRHVLTGHLSQDIVFELPAPRPRHNDAAGPCPSRVRVVGRGELERKLGEEFGHELDVVNLQDVPRPLDQVVEPCDLLGKGFENLLPPLSLELPLRVEDGERDVARQGAEVGAPEGGLVERLVDEVDGQPAEALVELRDALPDLGEVWVLRDCPHIDQQLRGDTKEDLVVMDGPVGLEPSHHPPRLAPVLSLDREHACRDVPVDVTSHPPCPLHHPQHFLFLRPALVAVDDRISDGGGRGLDALVDV
mmetsp:Transcript_2756/g.9238  ORF Transcript_2756/g.9238 Transcript_2756/m.9238 type:complete len:265 (-) Transcript_2756:206-1000(-)